MNRNVFDIAGKNAIVTGAAMGIGFGIAKRFVEAGANVLLADVNGDSLAVAMRKLSGPGKAAGIVADVGEDRAGALLVGRCVESFGSLDVLVNNAGIFPSAPMLSMTPELFDRVLRVNLRGLAFLSRAAGQRMIEQGRGGRMVNIASIDSFHPSMIGLAAYDASKGGVLMFTRNFALEMAPHRVWVNGIAPGAIRTEGASRPLEGSGVTASQQEKVLASFAERIPMRRLGEPDDIAKVAQFLASSASDYMTGETLVVDGGFLLT